MTTYTFESSDEGFTLSGQGSLEYTFADWLTTATGVSHKYNFEIEPKWGYDLVQSINGYTTAVIESSWNRLPSIVQRGLSTSLKELEIYLEDGTTKIFEGELR